ncbi:anthranilate synthase component I family protein [Campylobacter sp. MIT 21-1685]|uniref:anthranilate synthase component I family protein n=1 Tax=unclassified Campylobacter TaxID=2593542 RepID=UPI00224B17FE|nr:MULTISPECIES: anthranilate synthase component I family protein [unclassified Campylobacter]MCX2683474.1 anthranilate synthase component I family protein [Campylobacter sp. MIT 21-1684]MCX2751755.1 anthranilate synthase component I family protein [Campylobacter sp. MIT 21-1682]MCX2807956.1 anthranilate synthase component I family protein [Campylobacter sp. MIT 21-1685]
MLEKKANFYYRQILERYENSYFAEDSNKVIIGIDVEFLDSNTMTFSELKAKFYQSAAGEKLCEYAGFFGVLSANFITLFEDLPLCEKKSYDFPLFLFANARAYLVYEKNTKMFFEFGDEKYFNFLNEEAIFEHKNCEFEILTSLEQEQEEYLSMISKAKEYLLSGDIFQVVLSKQLCIQHNVDSFSFYETLSVLNPSAYMFYFPSSYGVVLGSSPEFMLKIKNKEIFVAPIAGTRNLDEKSDISILEKELLSDEKELSEHKMLVDLARNDSSKFGTKTRVENLFSILKSKYVIHIVSEVYATMKDGADLFDVISAVFPAGTLSGAPKIRALQIIAELEKLDRGVYGGAVGFLNFNEDVVLAIIIRSAFFKDTKAFIASGGGIVFESQAHNEYAEICAKRKALLVSFEKLQGKL